MLAHDFKFIECGAHSNVKLQAASTENNSANQSTGTRKVNVVNFYLGQQKKLFLQLQGEHFLDIFMCVITLEFMITRSLFMI